MLATAVFSWLLNLSPPATTIAEAPTILASGTLDSTSGCVLMTLGILLFSISFGVRRYRRRC